MTTNAELTKTNSSVRFAGVGLATLWVAASIWQQCCWLYASFSAVTCGPAMFPGFFTWTLVTTIVVMVVSAGFHLKIGARQGHPERAGSVIAGVGLGISFVIGVAALLFNLIFVSILEMDGGMPPAVARFVDEFVVLAMFVTPPLAGIASLLIARSKTALARMGSVNRGRLSFGIAAGLSAWALVAVYIGAAINCGADWVLR